MKLDTILSIFAMVFFGFMVMWILAGCIVTPPMITDVYRDGNELVFHKATIQVNTVTYQVSERDGRDIRVQIK